MHLVKYSKDKPKQNNKIKKKKSKKKKFTKNHPSLYPFVKLGARNARFVPQQCGFLPGLTQTRLFSHWRWLEAWNFVFRK